MTEQPVRVTPLVVVGGIALVLGAIVTAAILINYRTPAAASDDQPPIIVSDGSIYFDAGDSNNPGKGHDSWVQLGSTQHWKAIKNDGHSVASFTVYVAGVVDPDQAKNCPQTTMPANAVEVDYTDPGAQPTALTFHVVHTDDGGGHNSPQVDADDPSGLAVRPTSFGAPPRLAAGIDNQGYISQIIATDSSGTKTCKLPEPNAANRSSVRITIVPERH